MHPTPAMTNESTIAGPANCAAAVPVSTKIPAPIIAPMPSVIRFTGPSARFSECSCVSAASAIIVLIGFVAKSLLAMHSLSDSIAPFVLLLHAPAVQRPPGVYEVLVKSSVWLPEARSVPARRDQKR